MLKGLSKHVYRWTPTRQGGAVNPHTVDERIDMNAHMEALRFYYDLIRNFDASDVAAHDDDMPMAPSGFYDTVMGPVELDTQQMIAEL
jgi:hypothetical protein